MENKPTITERLWKWVTCTMAIVGFACWIWSTNVEFVYQKTLPRHPDPVAGRVYPLNVHGIVVYLTREEQDRLYGREWSPFAIAMVGGLLYKLPDKKFWESFYS
jgi:hypothetical protein